MGKSRKRNSKPLHVVIAELQGQIKGLQSDVDVLKQEKERVWQTLDEICDSLDIDFFHDNGPRSNRLEEIYETLKGLKDESRK